MQSHAQITYFLVQMRPDLATTERELKDLLPLVLQDHAHGYL